jgi:sec-independent protein translocase protein TatA
MLLFLNDIAGSEVLLILVFILIFFGSKSIPSIAKTFGKTIYQIKQASNDLQDEIKKSGLDIKKDLNIREKIQEITDEIQIPLDQQIVEMDNIVNYNPPKPAYIPENKTPLPIESEEVLVKEEVRKEENPKKD